MKSLDCPPRLEEVTPPTALPGTPALTFTHENHLEKLQSMPAMAGLKHILVPIDFSDLSIEALKYALPMATKFNAKITLLNVVEYLPLMPVYGLIEPPQIQNDLVEERERRLKALAKEMGQGLLDSAVVKSGSPSETIVHYANEWNFDMIILTTHGMTGLQHFLMGSTAEKVVRHAQCPVLVVHSRKISEEEKEEEAPRADLYGHVLAPKG